MPNDQQKQPPQPANPPPEESLDEESAAQPAAPSGPAADNSSKQPASPTSPAAPPSDEPAAGQAGGKKGLPGAKFLYGKLYLVVFIMLVLVGGLVIFISLKTAKPATTTTKTGSLTSDQLASIKGNTTLVGDAKQTIDIQSNSIFEGQVLLRSDLNIAGTVKVGGKVSLPSIDVAGSGSFGQLSVNGGMNVSGDTALQGQLTVQKNLSVAGSASFGSLNVSTLGVTSLQLKGDLSLNQHILASGGVPSRSNGTALGSGGTASVSGSDTAGTVAINTGGGPPAGCFITVNFVHKFSSTPHVVISPASSAAATIQYYTNQSSSGFSVCTADVPAAGTNYVYNYVVIQ